MPRCALPYGRGVVAQEVGCVRKDGIRKRRAVVGGKVESGREDARRAGRSMPWRARFRFTRGLVGRTREVRGADWLIGVGRGGKLLDTGVRPPRRG